MNSEINLGYIEALRKFRFEFSSGGIYVCAALILLGIGLDYAFYPEFQIFFGSIRIFVVVLIFFIYGIMCTKRGRPYVQSLTFLWLMTPQIMIAWMIGYTEGATSIYYSGLNLAIYASGAILAFGLWQNILFGTITYGMYAYACSLHPDSFKLQGPFIVNSLFILFTIAVSAFFSYFNERARFMMFQLKTEVAEKNIQLEKTNKDLAEIKGQMLQQEKMAAIGTLAAGLLHEVNNPINFCLMAIEIAREDPTAKSNSLINECLIDAREGMVRIQNIVSNLKTFAYRKPGINMELKSFLFEKALESAIRLTGHEIKTFKMVQTLPADTLVIGDEAAIIGVLINLLSNAALALRSANRPDPSIAISAEWVSARLYVTVKDNGRGITQENLSRIFEPFFTTREVGKGLGLGLSISYSVIKQHDGTLVAESVPGEWTKMIFDLPRAE